MGASLAVHAGLAATLIALDRPGPAADVRPEAAPMELVSWYTAPAPTPEVVPAATARAPAPDAALPREIEERPRDVAMEPRREPVPERPATLAVRGEERALVDLAALDLQTVPVEFERPTELTANGWPLITNPDDLQHFLRARYNPVRLASHAAGYVQVALLIDPRGKVLSSMIRESSGDPSLDAIALTLLGQIAEFNPPRVEGPPRPVTILIIVPFNSLW